MKRYWILAAAILLLAMMAGCQQAEPSAPVQTQATGQFDTSAFEVGFYLDTDHSGVQFSLLDVTESAVVFSAVWPGEIESGEIAASFADGQAAFSENGLAGALEAGEGGSIVLQITQSQREGVEPGEYILYYFGTQENAADALTTVIVSMSDSLQGWIRQSDSGQTVYICFRSDGIVDWWYGNGELTHKRDIYWIEDGVVHFGNDSYDMYAYMDEQGYMTMAAKEDYAMDLSGDYILQQDPQYQKLYLEEE